MTDWIVRPTLPATDTRETDAAGVVRKVHTKYSALIRFFVKSIIRLLVHSRLSRLYETRVTQTALHRSRAAASTE